MRSIAPPSGTSVRKNSICFSSKSIGVAQPPSALPSSLDEKVSGPKLIQSPVALCSRRAPADDNAVLRTRGEGSPTLALAGAALPAEIGCVAAPRLQGVWFVEDIPRLSPPP